VITARGISSLCVQWADRTGTTGYGGGPHITPEDAFLQVNRVSNATGISENPTKTMITLNIERNRSENFGAFAPDYVNVLTLNLMMTSRSILLSSYDSFVLLLMLLRTINNNNNNALSIKTKDPKQCV
jgi:hypothetical protein